MVADRVRTDRWILFFVPGYYPFPALSIWLVGIGGGIATLGPANRKQPSGAAWFAIAMNLLSFGASLVLAVAMFTPH